jgi:hypothetical protein
VLVLAEESLFDEPFHAWLLNSSPGGLRLALRVDCLTEGSILHVKAADAGTAAAWTRVRVRNRLRTEKQWELGCQRVYLPQQPTTPKR